MRLHASLATALVALLTACVGPALPEGPPGDAPLGPVFLVHGSWPDNPWLWVDDLQEALQAAGVASLSVPHGVVVGIGTDAPTGRLAGFAQELQAEHSRTRCRAPLRLVGVGYSSGTDVLLHAGTAGVPFDRCYFAGSPLALWNGELRQALRAGAIRRLVNYFSPLDGLMWMTAGAGIFGYHGAGWTQVDNRLHFWPHVTPLWNRGYMVERLVDELTREPGPRHTCYQEPWYLDWYRGAAERLRTDWSEREDASAEPTRGSTAP